MMKYLLTCLLLLCPLAAAAQSQDAAKSLSDCERIKNDMAYNQCLASFGPKRGERATRAVVDEDAGPAVGRAAAGSRSVRRGRGGRQAAAFDVVSGRRGASRQSVRPTRSAAARAARGSRKRR
jgi:hypothetical protein